MRTFTHTTTVIALLFSVALCAQEETIVWGSLRSESDAGEFKAFLGMKDNNTYVKVKKKDKPWMEVHDVDMNVRGQVPLEPEVPGMKSLGDDNSEVLFLEDRIIVVNSRLENAAKKLVIFATAYALDDLRPMVPLKQIYDQAYDEKPLSNVLSSWPSHDGRTFVTQVGIVTEMGNGHQTMPVLEFSAALELMDTRVEGIGPRWNPDSPRQYFAVAGGKEDAIKLHVIRTELTTSDGRGVEDKGPKMYSRVLQRINRLNADTMRFELPTGPFLHKDTYLRENEHGIRYVGFFTAEKVHGLMGTFSILLTKEGEVLHNNFAEFTDEYITALMGEGRQERLASKADEGRTDLVLSNYEYRGTFMLESEKAVMVREFETSRSTDNMVRCSSYDVRIICHDADGSVAWAITVPKFQVSVNDAGVYNGVATIPRSDGVSLLYNGTGGADVSDLHYRNVYSKSNKEGRHLVILHVDEEGKTTRKQLPDPGNGDTLFVPEKSVSFGRNTMAILARWKDDFRIGRISLE
jgi:hypothetical protein